MAWLIPARYHLCESLQISNGRRLERPDTLLGGSLSPIELCDWLVDLKCIRNIVGLTPPNYGVRVIG